MTCCENLNLTDFMTSEKISLLNRHSGPTVTFLTPPFDRSSMATSTHDARIELAMADLANQAKPNLMATSKKYGVARMTLRDRFTGQSLSKQAAASKYR